MEKSYQRYCFLSFLGLWQVHLFRLLLETLRLAWKKKLLPLLRSVFSLPWCQCQPLGVSCHDSLSQKPSSGSRADPSRSQGG
ncbi:hypothetical protein BJV78DRAFT_1260976 [Lactifluus subvellereus]|nr:hypothetical protein BJV78DRAFT_1260976 [Lactifluus subvellereus]